MRAMKDTLDLMMNAMKEQTATLNNLVHRTNSSSTVQVIACPLPPKFQISTLEIYDGMKDTLDHPVATLESFSRVFLNKHKLHNLIKRKFYILTTTTIKKHANT